MKLMEQAIYHFIYDYHIIKLPHKKGGIGFVLIRHFFLQGIVT